MEDLKDHSKREDLLHTLSSQHSRIVLRDDIVQLIHQLGTFHSDMGCSFLKILDCKHLVLITIAVSVLMDVISKTAGDISTVVWNGFSIKDHQHAFKIR